MATVIQKCSYCGQQSTRRCQPFIHGRYPAENLMMSFGILLSGVNISQVFLMFRHTGLSAISPSSYFLHQLKFLFPSVFMHKYRAALIDKLKHKKNSQWSGDGRFDSMGINAKYGVYTMFSNSISKLVDFEMLQVSEYTFFKLI